MTDEELQALIKNACKAAGWPIKKTLHASVVSVWMNDAPVIIKLADDDGDSRMLQVACKIGLHFIDDIVEHARATAVNDRSGVYMYVSAEEQLKDDDRKAARLAVLRCAGMIGEAME